jgi:glutamine synthetase
MAVLEYIWLDGYAHNKEHPNEVANLRAKIKVVPEVDKITSLEEIPAWSFDGSSTMQASGSKSDCVLKPVYFCENPLAFYPNHGAYLVMCEVMNPDGTPHSSNTRAKLVETWNKYKHHEMWFALEQEYAIYDQYGENPYGWPEKGYPAPQGRYYCGVGSDVAWGRDISEDHLSVCLDIGLPISGTNAEVMPSQWEFQMGPGEAPTIADQLWIARFLLNKIAEKSKATIKLDPKPVKGDWNGTGCHINFSTKEMREKLTMADVEAICGALEKNIQKHLAVYGKNNDQRLTGKHETCSINQFRFGESDRGASIRIPPGILAKGKGYLEDRRPAANIDPYEACEAILSTVCGVYQTV